MKYEQLLLKQTNDQIVYEHLQFPILLLFSMLYDLLSMNLTLRTTSRLYIMKI